MTHPLLQAAEIISKYAETLNTEQHVCECCGLIKYTNFAERGRHTELEGVVRKLQRFSGADEKGRPG